MIKKTFISIITATILIASCKENNQSEVKLKPTNSDTVQETKQIKKEKRIDSTKINSNDISISSIFFVGLEGVVYLYFEKDEAIFTFGNNRCDYTFNILNEDNRIKIKWGLEGRSCDYDSGLERKYNVKQPRKDDVFAEVLPYNDTIIKINYLYPAFIKKINERGRINELPIDTLFPKLFVIANR